MRMDEMVTKVFDLKNVFIVFTLCSTVLCSQNIPDRYRAEQATIKYMSLKFKNYKASTFGELFKQTHPNEIQENLKTKNQVEYSLVHSYSTGKKEFIHDYFHLDKNYEVIGLLTETEMTRIENDILQKSGKMDSLLNTIPLPD